jgi:pilus assembly protein CpaE
VGGTVGLIGADVRDLERLVSKIGMRSIVLTTDQLTTARGPAIAPDAVLVDVRNDRGLLAVVPMVKRRYPATAVAIVAATLESELMLEALRAGVNEVIPEPLTEAGLETSIGRIVVPSAAPSAQGRLIAIIGAKGGVGATTIAVNLAEAFARTTDEALLVDLHVGSGDAAVLLGAQPRFSVVEALENTHRLDEAFLRGLLVRTKSGLDLLAASSRVLHGAVDPQRVRTLLEFLGAFSPTVVLDVPRQDLGLLESLDAASAIFVIVNQELPTLKNAQPLAKRLQQRYGGRVGVLVNRSDRNSEISLDDIAKAVAVPIRHVFPNDYRHAMSAANKGHPVASQRQGRLAESFYVFAATFAGTTKRSAGEESGRLFGWLSSRK